MVNMVQPRGADYLAYAFVDGGYLRQRCTDNKVFYANPTAVAQQVLKRACGQARWPTGGHSIVGLARVHYYDARPDDASSSEIALSDYWEAIEALPDTEVVFGYLRRSGKKRRAPKQKGVDTLLAVDMLTGAFERIYKVAVLIAGDSDFVPVVDAIRRYGVMVVLGSVAQRCSDELKRSADRYVDVMPILRSHMLTGANDRTYGPSASELVGGGSGADDETGQSTKTHG